MGVGLDPVAAAGGGSRKVEGRVQWSERGAGSGERRREEPERVSLRKPEGRNAQQTAQRRSQEQPVRRRRRCGSRGPCVCGLLSAGRVAAPPQELNV